MSSKNDDSSHDSERADAPDACAAKPEGDDPFHDNERGDVFDLYNACNGALREDGLLDDSKLDELSAEEIEILDIPRLKEVWQHTASGCAQCKAIITDLNSARETLKGRPTKSS